VNYDLWLGPAPERPFNKNRFHYNWHWFWDYGCGDIGNQGPHQFDMARWGMNKQEHPVKIQSAGGYYQWDSDQETPNTQIATYEYADGKLLQFEVRGRLSELTAALQECRLVVGRIDLQQQFALLDEAAGCERLRQQYDFPADARAEHDFTFRSNRAHGRDGGPEGAVFHRAHFDQHRRLFAGARALRNGLGGEDQCNHGRRAHQDDGAKEKRGFPVQRRYLPEQISRPPGSLFGVGGGFRHRQPKPGERSQSGERSGYMQVTPRLRAPGP